ncbi:hypothetical protein U1E44_14915 [Arenibacter sp. GZD96]|uniref:hypothetical protein n=1 Tax=Aurantibrevibacter litoralis TaxID=3106030 RepID=UPI002AFE731A|nr:hypothetical protein [Arenibacter sp. GZD-96]MEA1787390.1 hypothetical protein [Arenibacter sp. GZD-96]
MKKFILKGMLYFFIGLVVAEIVSRLFFVTSDIPRRQIGEDGIQKYIPSQTGYWKGGKHQWQINKKGWPGPLPGKWDPLVTVIGDSFIENLMNPDSCHQGSLLKDQLPNMNFFETARSGVSFIGAMEISEQNQYLNPKFQILYVSDNDFEESISDIKAKSDITQWNVADGKLIPGKMKSPKLKLILYNWKFAYYLYNRFPIKLNFRNIFVKKSEQTTTSQTSNSFELYHELLKYVKENYRTDNLILVFRPETSSELVELVSDHGIKNLLLKKNSTKSWSFADDHHWTCYGHEQAAKQVAASTELSNY